MEILKLTGYKNNCDEIHYEIKNGQLDYVEFFLNGRSVMTEFKNSLTGFKISDLAVRIRFATINPVTLMILNEFVKNLEKTNVEIKLKRKIFKLKHQ